MEGLARLASDLRFSRCDGSLAPVPVAFPANDERITGSAIRFGLPVLHDVVAPLRRALRGRLAPSAILAAAFATLRA